MTAVSEEVTVLSGSRRAGGSSTPCQPLDCLAWQGTAAAHLCAVLSSLPSTNAATALYNAAPFTPPTSVCGFGVTGQCSIVYCSGPDPLACWSSVWLLSPALFYVTEVREKVFHLVLSSFGLLIQSIDFAKSIF